MQSLINEPSGESSATIRERVNRARMRQHQRFAGSARVYCNAQMSAKEVKKFCQLNQAASDLLMQAITRLGLSARAYHRILKIALTIADLSGAEQPETAHIAEAIQYRRPASAC